MDISELRRKRISSIFNSTPIHPPKKPSYHKYRWHGSSERARFYAASTVMAFEHLHDRNVIYRDLKPENLLIDGFGRCKLTDMGLAKQTAVKTYTTCGTPDYFAPEVINPKVGQGPGVDWWTLGVLIHELMSGHTPFESASPDKIYQKVMRGVTAVQFPYAGRDPQAAQLVKMLLQSNAAERLPMQPGGIKNIQTHAWYSGFKWDSHIDGSDQPPFKPEVQDPTDMRNFKAREADIPPQIPYKDPGSGWDGAFATSPN